MPWKTKIIGDYMKKQIKAIVLLVFLIIALLIVLGSLPGCSSEQYDFARINKIDSLCDRICDTAAVYHSRTDSDGIRIYNNCQFFLKGLRENRKFLLDNPKYLVIE